MYYLSTHTSLSPIWRGFSPGFVIYKHGCIRLTAASDKVYQLLAHGRWFSPGTPASSTTKIGRHDIAELLLKVTLKHNKSNHSKPRIQVSTNISLSVYTRKFILMKINTTVYLELNDLIAANLEYTVGYTNAYNAAGDQQMNGHTTGNTITLPPGGASVPCIYYYNYGCLLTPSSTISQLYRSCHLSTVTRHVSLVEQERLTLPEHPSSSPVLVGFGLLYP